jgi:hypothetical protein
VKGWGKHWLPPTGNPCKECPFKVKSLPGYLGEHTCGEFIERWYYEHPMECHTTVHYTVPEEELVKQLTKKGTQVRWCSGALIMMKNECKRPRDKKMAKLVDQMETSDLVLANRSAFIAHHNTKVHHDFVRSLRARGE